MYRKILVNERGQGLVEIGLIIALVAAVAILSLAATGTSLQDLYCRVVKTFNSTGECSLPGNEGPAFSEDFSDISDWHISWGKWDNSDGTLFGERWGAIFSQDFTGEDYTVNIDLANLEKGNGYGVWFRAQDFDRPEGYIFQYDPGWGGGAFLMRKWVDGHELRPFAVERAPGFDWHGQDHQVKIDVQGDTFTAYVNGEAVLSASDDTYTVGTIGLRTWDNTHVTFDDITIETP